MEKRSKSKGSLSKKSTPVLPNGQELENAWAADLPQATPNKGKVSSKKNTPKPQSTPKQIAEPVSVQKSKAATPKSNKGTPKSNKGTPKSSLKKQGKTFEEQLKSLNPQVEEEEKLDDEIDVEVDDEIVEEDQVENENNGGGDDMDDLIDEELLGDEDLEEGLDADEIERRKEENRKKALEFKEAQEKKGVLYLSSIPPYMKVSQLRKLFAPYDVERIYLTPEEEGKRKFREKTGGNKRRKYTEGWMEFKDKKMAKYVATVFNNQKIGGKRGGFYSEDVLNLRYLPKFKWENLTEKIHYDLKMRKEKMRNELSLASKQHSYYLEQVEKGKKIMGIKKKQDMKRAALDDIEEVLKAALDEDKKPKKQGDKGDKSSSFDDEKDRVRRMFKQKKPKLNE